MKKLGPLAATVAVSSVLLGGCWTHGLSVNPLFTDKEAMDVSGLAGNWTEAEDGSSSFTLRPLGQGRYELVTFEEGKRQRPLSVSAGRLGGELYWDVTAKPGEDEGPWGAHRLQIHSFARVRLEGDRLEIAFLNADALEEAIQAGRFSLSHEHVDDQLLLLAPTEELQELILALDDGLYASTGVFQRERHE
jgi:hypothetical protein